MAYTQFPSKYPLMPGSSYSEVVAHARKEFNAIRRLSKRQPYVKSKYFKGDKIFMTVFWDHIMQKHPKERTRRLKFYKAAVDLLRNTTCSPEATFESTTNQDVILFRFYGRTKDGSDFCVQVKHDLRSGRKDFMSVFQRKPQNKKPPAV